MNNKDNVIPMPRKETNVDIKQSPGCGISFNILVEENDYITVSNAAEILGVTKERIKQLIEERNVEKHCVTGERYLLLRSDIDNL